MGLDSTSTTLRKPLRAALLAGVTALALVAASGTAYASQIFVQTNGTSAAGGDPNLLAHPDNFVIGQSSNLDLQNPLLVIVGVYNGNQSTTRPTLSYKGQSATPASVFLYGLTKNQATFTNSSGTNSSGTSAFGLLGLRAGGSESFGNWVTGDTTKISLAAPTSFELFAYQLGVGLTGKSTINVGVSRAPIGSYVLAYDGCRLTKNGDCAKNKKGQTQVGQTVFTNTGLIDGTNVPEPGSLALLGTGLLGLGLVMRRKRRLP